MDQHSAKLCGVVLRPICLSTETRDIAVDSNGIAKATVWVAICKNTELTPAILKKAFELHSATTEMLRQSANPKGLDAIKSSMQSPIHEEGRESGPIDYWTIFMASPGGIAWIRTLVSDRGNEYVVAQAVNNQGDGCSLPKGPSGCADYFTTLADIARRVAVSKARGAP
jgi:hypothetical protein